MLEYGKKVMTNNSINTTKANSHLSHQTIEHKIRHNISPWILNRTTTYHHGYQIGPQHITMDINILILGRYNIFVINRSLNKKIITSFSLFSLLIVPLIPRAIRGHALCYVQ